MYFFFSAIAWCVSRLSDANIDRLARGLTILTFDWLRIRKKLILKNLEIAFGTSKSPAERLDLARESSYHFILTVLEFFRTYKVDIAAHVELKGEEHIRQALEKQQGAYILCFHMGNWEAMGAKITREVAPAHVLVKKVKNSSLNRFVDDMREKSGFLTVKRQKKGDGYAAIKDVLERREIVGFVMDQARPGEPRLPFFGTPAKTNTSLAAIWRKTPAPIVPAYIHRTGVGQHVLEFFPEMDLKVTEDAAKDIIAHSQIFNKKVEESVKVHPGQYFWAHNRWK